MNLFQFRKELEKLLDDSKPHQDFQIHERNPQHIQKSLKHLPNFGKKINRLPLDGEYFCVDAQAIDKFLANEHTSEREYKTNKFDCENFAISAVSSLQMHHAANNLGLVVDWSNAHAYNVFVAPNGEVHLIEPQTDSRYKVVERKQDGSLNFVGYDNVEGMPDNLKFKHGKILL